MTSHPCQYCGKPIGAGRLKALPNAITCVVCSEEKARTERDVPLDGADQEDAVRQVRSDQVER